MAWLATSQQKPWASTRWWPPTCSALCRKRSAGRRSGRSKIPSASEDRGFWFEAGNWTTSTSTLQPEKTKLHHYRRRATLDLHDERAHNRAIGHNSVQRAALPTLALAIERHLQAIFGFAKSHHDGALQRIIMTGPGQHRSWSFGSRRGAPTAGLVLAIVFVLAAVATQSAQAQTYTVIHNFTGGADGAYPVAGLTMDRAGNLYGTTSGGGASGNGTVFRLSYKGSGWVLNPLYRFAAGNDGLDPRTRVVIGPDGSLYGTTSAGGGTACNFGYGLGCGTVFNLKPSAKACTSALCSWTEIVLYRFSGTDGALPLGDVVFDQAGNLYGTTAFGGGVGNCSGDGFGCG